MISGNFGERGELFFEIELIAANGEQFSVEALLDTGFTTGWLAINPQDLEALKIKWKSQYCKNFVKIISNNKQ